MRTIKHTTKFRRDYKREKLKRHGVTLDSDLLKVVELLIVDERLPNQMRDHPLVGNWKDHRDCHIKPDLVLIYRKIEPDILELVRLGSHSELGF